MIIHSIKSKIEIKIGDISFWVSPMTFSQKAEIAACSRVVKGKVITDQRRSAFLAIKFSIKECKGLKNPDGSDYKLEMEDYNESIKVLKDETVENLLAAHIWGSLMLVCNSLIGGIPTEILGDDGKPAKGIKLVVPKIKKKTGKK